MTNHDLRHVSLQTLDNVRQAGLRAVAAYRHGGHRLVGAFGVVPPKARGLLDEGIDRVADGTGRVIETGAAQAAAQLERAARFAGGVKTPLVANGLAAAAKLSLPGARVALVLSGKAAEGAQALADAAGARPVRRAVRRGAAGAKTAAKRGATRVAKAAQAPARRAKKAVAA